MNPTLAYEIIGYIASALVAVSLMMSSVFRLRVINLVGALLFALYGLFVSAYPVALMNALIVLIDLYYLREIIISKKYRSVIES